MLNNGNRRGGDMRQETKGLLLGLLGITAFGLTLPITREVVSALDPLFVGLGRAFVAGLVATLWLAVTHSPVPRRRHWPRLLLVAAGAVLGFPLLSAWAMQTLPASHGGVVLGVLPLMTALVGTLMSDERPSMGFWLAGIAGSAVVVGYALQRGGGVLQPGDLALLGAVLSAAVAYAAGGQLAKDLGGGAVICWALVLALPFIAVPTLMMAPRTLAALPTQIWMGFLYLALVSQLFGFFLWNAGLALGGIARVSQVQLLQPLVTLLASGILLGERIDVATMGYALSIIALVALGRRMPIRSSPCVAGTHRVCGQRE
jgi:drug/metabolite transporter (DMT)-like permease